MDLKLENCDLFPFYGVYENLVGIIYESLCNGFDEFLHFASRSHLGGFLPLDEG